MYASVWCVCVVPHTRRYFYTTLTLGTPPRTFALIIDTGSTVTYVPCADCTHCGQHQVRLCTSK